MQQTLRKELFWITLKAMLALLLVPLVTLGFAHHFKQSTDSRYQAELIQSVNGDASLPAEQRAAIVRQIQTVKPSETCSSADSSLDGYRDAVCAPYSELHQFVLAEKAATWTLIGSLALLGVVALLAGLAFARRSVRYVSFVTGWRLLTLSAATIVVTQAAFLVWLSFWVTAFFTQSYFVKLILIAGLFALGAVAMVVIALFRFPKDEYQVLGAVVDDTQAPALWRRIRALADTIGTPPPDHLVMGIDDNFFVTEQPLNVGERRVEGRSLFVSLPLLRVLAQSEADAVLAHELGHYAGGDTRDSARLGPALSRYDLYRFHMHEGGLTKSVAYLLDFYRVMFELALRRSSREREFAADRVAAERTSPRDIAHSLIKISAYSEYRGRIEQQLFAQDVRHDDRIGIADRIAQGLQAFARSEHFLRAMRSGSVPHPFDSHPPMHERMKQAGYPVDEADYAGIACDLPAATWAGEIIDADKIESALWAVFEQQFAQAHEEQLAWRYLPETEEERQIVLRYFPQVRIDLPKGRALEVNHEGIVDPDQGQLIEWETIERMSFDKPLMQATRVVLVHTNSGPRAGKTTPLKLGLDEKGQEALGEILGRYHARHRASRAYMHSLARDPAFSAQDPV